VFRHGIGLIATAALLFPRCAGAEGFGARFLARAYFESAYLSSGGVLTYTKPVAEQYALVQLDLWDYGRVKFDAWTSSALNDQTDHIHRRAFYICEDTLMYGYDLKLGEKATLSTDAGALWDFLGGYEKTPEFPVNWYAYQGLANPYVVPYWNALGRMYSAPRIRIRLGVQRGFTIFKSLYLVPYVETTWGDPSRFEASYGGELEHTVLGGSFMFCSVGFLAEWRFSEHFYVWGRFREYVVIDPEARALVAESDSPTAKEDYPIFGLGLGCRF